MAISSQGIGSGLDVNSIVTQLVAIEKQPLQGLKTKATTFQSQLSLYGTVKSQASTLGDAAALLATASQWTTQKASSSNTSAVGVTLGSTATAQTISVEVSKLARAQSAASTGVPTGTAVGLAGTLTLQLGSWSGLATALEFTPGATASADVAVLATDTMSDIAAKINAASAGVTATVLRDGANDRLVMRSTTTGADAGFSVATAGDAGMAMFGISGTIDSTNATPATGMFLSQTALNAAVKINGVSVSSASNKLTDVVTGITLQISQETTAPVEILVENDTDAIQKNIQSFVDAYNALNQTLTDATKYDATSKKGGVLQGDSVTVGLQNAFRSMLGSSSVGSTYARLSDIGLERQLDGSMKIKASKLTSAISDLSNLKSLFTTNNSDTATNGFGLKVRDFARGLVAVDGRVSSKYTAIQGSITRNSTEQERVNDRAARVETDLRRQYTALDAQMAQLNGLSSYVTAQLAQWNKPSN
jgi:flagellar hook-associated protein 2